MREPGKKEAGIDLQVEFRELSRKLGLVFRASAKA